MLGIIVVIHGKNFNYIRYRPAYMQKLSPSYANKLLCLIDTTKPDLFFSLVDYRNNYFTSDYPNKIIEFYNGFEKLQKSLGTPEEFRHLCEHKDCEAHHEKKQPCIAICLPQEQLSMHPLQCTTWRIHMISISC